MSTQDQAIEYYRLINQGVPPAQAFKQAFPNGIESQEDKNKKAAKDGQKAAVGQIGGTLAGALATKYLVSKIGAEAATKVAADAGASGATGGGATAGGGAAGGSGAAGAEAGGTTATAEGSATTGGAEAGSGVMGGTAATAGLGLMAALAAQNWWEGGGKDIASGKAKKDDWFNATVMDSNPVLGWVNPALRIVGLPSVGRMLGGGGTKSEGQAKRDAIRNALQGQGITDDHDVWKLANGQSFDFGLDGGSGVQNVDTSDQMGAMAVGLANPIATMLAHGDKDQATWLAGRLANGIKTGATSVEDLRRNAEGIARQLGLNPENMRQGFAQLANEQKLDPNSVGALSVGAGTIFDPEQLKRINPVTSEPNPSANQGDQKVGFYPTPTAQEVAARNAQQAAQGQLPQGQSIDPGFSMNPQQMQQMMSGMGQQPQAQSNGQYRLSPGVYTSDVNKARQAMQGQFQQFGMQAQPGQMAQQVQAVAQQYGKPAQMGGASAMNQAMSAAQAHLPQPTGPQTFQGPSQMGGTLMQALQGVGAKSQRPAGFDEDPNHPGRYIRRR